MRISTSQFQAVSIKGVLEQQAKLAKIQQQVASGKRIVTPADDPANAARALQIDTRMADLEQVQENAGMAKTRLQAEEGVLIQVGDLLQRVRDLSLQANNATQDAENRRYVATELRQRLDQLVQLSNSTDGNGEYLFAGANSRNKPFAQTAAGVEYNGDQTERMAQVGPDRQMAVNHTGFDVFMKVRNGNGTFVAAPDAGNTGTGVVALGGVSDAGAASTGYPYHIDFLSDPVSGELQYTVTSAAGVDGPTAYQAGDEISFGGVSVRITGTPGVGDRFEVDRSRNQSMFVTLENLIGALETYGDTPVERASVNNAVNRALAELDQAGEKILSTRASVGARLNALESEIDSIELASLDLEATRSDLVDLDYAKAISEFQLKLTGLQAAQQSYVQIQGLSLFNFL